MFSFLDLLIYYNSSKIIVSNQYVKAIEACRPICYVSQRAFNLEKPILNIVEHCLNGCKLSSYICIFTVQGSAAPGAQCGHLESRWQRFTRLILWYEFNPYQLMWQREVSLSGDEFIDPGGTRSRYSNNSRSRLPSNNMSTRWYQRRQRTRNLTYENKTMWIDSMYVIL